MDGKDVVWPVFKDFGAAHRPNIRITKLECAEGRHPDIPVGQIVEGTFTSEVKVGESFNLRNATVVTGGSIDVRNMLGVTYPYWCTSIVQEIISNNTFKTINSVYKWEVIK